jgi:hypothetical protein
MLGGMNMTRNQIKRTLSLPENIACIRTLLESRSVKCMSTIPAIPAYFAALRKAVAPNRYIS